MWWIRIALLSSFAMADLLAALWLAFGPYAVGLDFEGGVAMRLRAVDPTETVDADQVRGVLDSIGLSGAVWQSGDELRVEIAGSSIDDRSRGRLHEALQPASLVLLPVHGDMVRASDRDALMARLAEQAPPHGHEWMIGLLDTAAPAFQQEIWAVAVRRDQPVLTGADVVDARVEFDPDQPYVAVALSPAGAERFETFTGANVGRLVAIVVDDQVVSAPMIRDRIPGGRISITMGAGSSGLEEARALATRLAFARGARLEVVDEVQIGGAFPPYLGRRLATGLAVLAALSCLAVVPVVAWLRTSIAPMVLGAAVTTGVLALAAPLVVGGVFTSMSYVGAAVVAIAVAVAVAIAGRGTDVRARVFAAIPGALLALVLLAGSVVAYALCTGPVRGIAAAVAIGVLPAAVLAAAAICTLPLARANGPVSDRALEVR